MPHVLRPQLQVKHRHIYTNTHTQTHTLDDGSSSQIENLKRLNANFVVLIERGCVDVKATTNKTARSWGADDECFLA